MVDAIEKGADIIVIGMFIAIEAALTSGECTRKRIKPGKTEKQTNEEEGNAGGYL